MTSQKQLVPLVTVSCVKQYVDKLQSMLGFVLIFSANSVNQKDLEVGILLNHEVAKAIQKSDMIGNPKPPISFGVNIKSLG